MAELFDQIYSSTATGLAIIILILALQRIVSYVSSLPPSHPAVAVPQGIWTFVNTPLISQTISYFIFGYLFARFEAWSVPRACSSSCSSSGPRPTTTPMSQDAFAEIIASAVRSALAENTGAVGQRGGSA